MKFRNRIYCKDVLEFLKDIPDNSIQTVITSPPYWGLRDYDCDGQIGNEVNIEDYINNLVKVFKEVKRVIRDDGTVWLNLGTTYLPKDQESEEMVLRDDLSEDEIKFVLEELSKNVKIKKS